MFKDITDYEAETEERFSVLVGSEVVDSNLLYGEALRLAQKTKGSHTKREDSMSSTQYHHLLSPDEAERVYGSTAWSRINEREDETLHGLGDFDGS